MLLEMILPVIELIVFNQPTRQEIGSRLIENKQHGIMDKRLHR
jgi:hypothetical protein